MNSKIGKKLEAATAFISARSHIAIGLVLLLITGLCLASTLDLIPDGRQAVMAARGKTCEEIAVFGSEFVQRNDLPGLDDALRTMADRNPDILSATLRRADGKNLMQIGDRVDEGSKADVAVDAEFDAPVFVDDKRWGQIEVRFGPVAAAANPGSLFSSTAKLIASIALASLIAILVFLRKRISDLDPSSVVPVRVRSAFDSLTEGLLVVDNGGRIVLANQAFSKLVGCESDQMLGARASQFDWTFEPGESGEFPWTRALREGKPLRDIHIRLNDANHKSHTLTVNCSPLLGEDGEYRGVVNSFGDITLPEKKTVTRRKPKDTANTAQLAAVGSDAAPMHGPRGAAKPSKSNKNASTLLAGNAPLPQANVESYDILFEFVDRLQAQLGAVQDACKKHDLTELGSLAQLVDASRRAAGTAITATASKRRKTVQKKKAKAKGGSLQKRRLAKKAAPVASTQSLPAMLSSTEVREAFATCPDQFPPILSLSQAARIARLKPASLARQVRSGAFGDCVSPGTPPLFWRDRFIMDLFNARKAA